MELDKRIIKGKKPLTAFDVMESKFIGTDCFFSDKPSDFADLSKCQVGKLMSLDAVSGMFGASKNNSYAVFYFCLPCEWVEEKKEAKYRPYSLEEFIGDVNLGLEPWITMRPVGTNKECKFLYTGYQETEVGEYICLGCFQFDFVSLFQNYEICINGEWQPFGVLEE